MNIYKYSKDYDVYDLFAQYRMDSGDEYLNFIKEFLQIIPETNKKFNFGNYDFKIFDTEEDLYKKVLDMEKIDSTNNSKSRLLSSLKYTK